MIYQASWVQLSDFPREVDSTVEDLLLDSLKLFSKPTDDLLHILKDLRAMLRSLGIYISAKKNRSHIVQRSHQFSS